MVVEAQEDMRVVLEPPPQHHGLQVGRQPRRASAGDEFTQGKRAEIGNEEGGAGLRRIRAPGRLLAVAFSGGDAEQPWTESEIGFRISGWRQS
jgi:hypothetical protein